MPSKRHRLDRFLIQHMSLKNKDVRLLLAQKKIILDQKPALSMSQVIDDFTQIQVDDQIIQSNKPSYIKLYKPRGVVSATKDYKHKTVIDLLPKDIPKDLHISGRLDFNTTGLLLLSNDGRWTRKLASPESHIEKRYQVTLDKPINNEVIETFETGIYFSYENIMTRTASLIPTGENTADVILKEGKYHQIKRMFGHFQIEVLALHRVSVGSVYLQSCLKEGEYKYLTNEEVTTIFDGRRLNT